MEGSVQPAAPVHVGAVIEDLQNEYDRSAQFLNDLLQSLNASETRQRRSSNSGPLEQACSTLNDKFGDNGIQIGRIEEENEEDEDTGLSLQERSPDPGTDGRGSKQKRASTGPVQPLRLPKQAGTGGRASPHPPSTGRASPHLATVAVSPARRRQSLDVRMNSEGPKGDRGARRSLDVDSAYARKGASGGRGSPTLEPLPPSKQPQPKAGSATGAASAAAAAGTVGSKDAGGARGFGRRLLNLFGRGKSSSATHAPTAQQPPPQPPKAHDPDGYTGASEHYATGGGPDVPRSGSGSGHTQWSRRDGTATATDVSGSQLARALTTDTSLSTSQNFDKLYSSELSGFSPAPDSAGVAAVATAAAAAAAAAGARAQGQRAPPAMAATSPDAARESGSGDQSKATRAVASSGSQRQPSTPLLAPGSGLPAGGAVAPAHGLPWTGSFASSASASFGPYTHTAATLAPAAAGLAQEPAAPQPPSLAEVLASASAEAQLPLRGGGRGGRQRRSSLDFTPALPAHLRASLDSSGLRSLTALGAAQEAARLRSSLATPLAAAAGGSAGGLHVSPGGTGRLRPSLELFGGTAPVARGETRGCGSHSGPLNLQPLSMQPAVHRAPGLQVSMPPPGDPGAWAAGSSYSTGQLVLVGDTEGLEDFRVAAPGASRGVYTGGGGGRHGGAAAGRHPAGLPAPAATWAAAEAAAASSVSAPLPTLHGVWAATPTAPAAAAAAAAAAVAYPGGVPAAAGSPVSGWRVRAPTSTEDAPLPRIGTAASAGTQHHPHLHHGLHPHGQGAELPCLRGHTAATTSASGESPPAPHGSRSATGAPGEFRHSREFGLAARKATHAPVRSGGGSGSLVLAGSSGGGGGGGQSTTVTLHPTADALLATMQTLHTLHNHHSQPNLVGIALPQSPSRFASSCPATHGPIATAAAAAAAAAGATAGAAAGGGSSSGGGAAGAASAAVPAQAQAVELAAEASVCGVAWAAGSVSSEPSGGNGDLATEQGTRGDLDGCGPVGRGVRRSEVGEVSPVRWVPQVPPPATLHALQAEPITGIAGRAALTPSAPGFGVSPVRHHDAAAASQAGLGGGSGGGGADGARGSEYGVLDAVSDTSVTDL